MGSWRTKPCLFFCEDKRGEKSGEYVVKLKAGKEPTYVEIAEKNNDIILHAL